jgi:hypothetical protein
VRYGLSRLLVGDLEQKVLAMASEILIVAGPVAAWIADNTPHPIAPTRLRLIVVLPEEDDDRDHYDNLHHATHVAVTLARMRAGLATIAWLPHGAHTWIGGFDPRPHLAAALPKMGTRAWGEVVTIAWPSGSEPQHGGMHVILDVNAHRSDTIDMFLGWSRRVTVENAWTNGNPPPVVINAGSR